MLNPDRFRSSWPQRAMTARARTDTRINNGQEAVPRKKCLSEIQLENHDDFFDGDLPFNLWKTTIVFGVKSKAKKLDLSKIFS
ncbi:hypothetical protein [Halothiobacillus sp. 15-55-196]|uniref:hypothetical protein n=1 Tax=Halothiobacillus sp. 15-55-196 TaxID=1970382 RepID=UPI0025B7B341|nr:hypothetical protein [Halothiobacillus sp. 15-55-196]